MSEEIHSLLGRYFSGQASEEEKQTVMNWVSSSTQNEEEFKLLEKLWNRSGDQDAIVFDTNKAWKTINAKLNPVISIEKRSNRFSLKMAIAAAATVMLMLSLWWIFSNKAKEHTVTAQENVKEIKLEDGSIVYLRKGSTLQYPNSFAKNNRRVILTGQAFFEVTHNTERPFIITAAQTEVTVVGTSFSVNTANNLVQLIVKTGLVNFSPIQKPRERIAVAAGEMAVYTSGAFYRSNSIDVNFNAWQTGKLVFKHTPMTDVLSALNDYYQTNIELKNDDAKQLATAKVTTTFNNEPLSSVLKELSTITSYRIDTISNNHYEISIKK